MSYFDDASLAFLPSGAAGKDGKAYSIKPTDGTGDFTFSRGSNLAATRVGADGLIEKGRENLLLQSNTFSDASWTKVSLTLAGGQSGYDGSSDAWLMTKSIVNNYVGLRRNGISITGVSTFSFYAKSGATNFVMAELGGNGARWFDLTNGSSPTGFGSGILSYSSQDVGNGWYRCSITTKGSNAISTVNLYVMATSGATTTAGSFYLQDAQLEVGLAATEYIESGATKGTAGILENTPRFDYSNGASCPSLLLEPSRTQLVRQSEYFQSSHWTKDSNTTLTTNAAISPDGSQNATRFESSSAVSGMFSYGVVGNKTISIYIKAGDTGNIGKSMRLYTTEAAGDFVLTNDWQRISLTGNASNLFALYPSAANGFTSAFIWGAQGEAASYPTSYIPNHSGGTITRAAEGVANQSIPNTPSLWSCLIDIDFSKMSLVNNKTFFNTTTTTGAMSWRFFNKSGAQVISPFFETSASYPFEPDIDNNRTDGRVLLRHNGGGSYTYFRSYLGVVTQTTATGLTETDLNQINFNGNDVKWASSQILVFPTALSDAECIELTTI